MPTRLRAGTRDEYLAKMRLVVVPWTRSWKGDGGRERVGVLKG